MARTFRNMTLAAVAASALVLAPFLSTTASAAPVDEHVLIFSNGNVVDTSSGQEYDQTLAAVQGTGATVTPFDGGDGSLATWTAALAGTDVLVIPEMEVGPIYDPAGTSWLSTDAATYLKTWVASGHQIIATGAYDAEPLFSFLTGVDYSGVWGESGTSDVWALQIADPTLPATLPNADEAAASGSFDTWTPEQLAPVTPIYLSTDGTNLGVGRFAVGAGSITSVAYDFFPDSDDIDSGAAGLWISALQGLVLDVTPAAVVTPPKPALATTGVDPSMPMLVAAILMLVGTGFVVARRRTAAHAG